VQVTQLSMCVADSVVDIPEDRERGASESASHTSTDSPLARSINKLNQSARSHSGSRPKLEDPYLGVLEDPREQPTNTPAGSDASSLPSGGLPRRARASVRSGRRSEFVSTTEPEVGIPNVPRLFLGPHPLFLSLVYCGIAIAAPPAIRTTDSCLNMMYRAL
jgi:hypothetical protein